MIKQSEILKAVFERAKTSPAITLVPPESIKSHIPQDAPLPYVRIRMDQAPNDDKTQFGYETNITFDVWSKKHSDGEVSQIVDELIEAFSTPLTVVGGNNFYIRRGNTVYPVEPDGQTHRASLACRLLSHTA